MVVGIYTSCTLTTDSVRTGANRNTRSDGWKQCLAVGAKEPLRYRRPREKQKGDCTLQIISRALLLLMTGSFMCNARHCFNGGG